MRKHLCEQQSEFNFCETVTDIHRARLSAEPVGHYPQIITQVFVALFDVVSNFAAFKIGNRRVGNPPPSHPLPFRQLSNLAAQNIRLSHCCQPALKKLVLADS